MTEGVPAEVVRGQARADGQACLRSLDMYKPISSYGIIGNLHSAALVGCDGSIDWLCLPHIDSPSVFGALLDDREGGRFMVAPVDPWDSVAEYVPKTNVLRTRFRTRTGVLEITDFMPVGIGGEDEREAAVLELYRRLRVLSGRVPVRVLFDPRFDYARGAGSSEIVDRGVLATGGGQRLLLEATRPLGTGETTWQIGTDETVWLRLSDGTGDVSCLEATRAEGALGETTSYWKSWLGRRETGRTVDAGPYQEMVDRSSLVLKLLYYNPTGAIAAAATTSLPEEIGGVRNWDYRYTWVRDTSFTLQALFNTGHLSEMEGYLRWFEGLLAEHGPERMQIMYGLRGEEKLPEEELPHLDGYKGSRPVRIGNGAATQRQLDIYGELLDAALKLSDYVGRIDERLWPFLRGICDYVTDHWREKDSGIWEVRGGPHHFVYSKVMCWVALDRGVTIADRYGFPADQARWKQVRGDIHREVLEKGWNEERGCFVQHYGTDALDASALLIPLTGFLPIDDSRVQRTIRAIRGNLERDGFLKRYRSEDGIAGSEGSFLLCSFWLIDCLIDGGEVAEAERLLNRIQGVANHLGLFSEEYDVDWREQLGNFPQAFTHIGFINSVTRLAEAGREEPAPERAENISLINVMLSPEIILNEGEPEETAPEDALAERLKETMNVLRGAFFDTQRGRVAYERMHGTEVYEEYLRLSRSLSEFDLAVVAAREERIAFWINLYNVQVIHAVIALGIRDSVKEVRNFFRRVRYRIGGETFSPDDIEHGILRGNRRPPFRIFRCFGPDDPRLPLVVDPVDPRIHFALVCASSSCPPIDVYTAEDIDRELDVAARAFLYGGGAGVDREKGIVSLSRIFKWYGGDFGSSDTEVLRFVARYLYDEADRDWIVNNADDLTIVYQEYDWRLNRG